jgi:hypothetical protein
MDHAPFNTWCTEQGVTTSKVTMQHSLQDGSTLMATAAIPSGTVLLNIPFKAVLSVETVPVAALPRRFPPFKFFAAALRPLHASRYEAKCSWLATMLATIVARESPLFRPYIGTFPPLGHLDVRRKQLLQQLSDAERQDVAALAADNRRFARHAHRIAARCFPRTTPPPEAFQWAHDVVLQRALTMPSFCVPSAPLSIGTFLQKDRAIQDDLATPALVPFADALAHGIHDANCELYTCIHKDFVDATHRTRARPTSVSLASHRRVVVCASQDIKAGEVLSSPLCKGIDKPMCVFRFGVLLVTSPAGASAAAAGAAATAPVPEEFSEMYEDDGSDGGTPREGGLDDDP